MLEKSAVFRTESKTKKLST